MPPPRSLAHQYHPLRGVITTSGGRVPLRPLMRVVRVNADAGVRFADAITRTSASRSASSATKADSSLETCRTGGPNGARKASALLGHNPGRPPRVTQTSALCRPCRRASPTRPAPAVFGVRSARPISASLPSGPIRPRMPSSPVNAPSKSGNPSTRRSSTTRQDVATSTLRSGNDSRFGVSPIRRISSNSQSPERRSTSVPVR